MPGPDIRRHIGIVAETVTQAIQLAIVPSQLFHLLRLAVTGQISRARTTTPPGSNPSVRHSAAQIASIGLLSKNH